MPDTVFLSTLCTVQCPNYSHCFFRVNMEIRSLLFRIYLARFVGCFSGSPNFSNIIIFKQAWREGDESEAYFLGLIQATDSQVRRYFMPIKSAISERASAEMIFLAQF